MQYSFQFELNDLAKEIFTKTHFVWTSDEIHEYWMDSANQAERNHYLEIAQISLDFWKPIFEKL